MGVKTKSKKQPAGSNLARAIVAQVEKHLKNHMRGILDFIEEAEDKKEAVSFNVKIDCSESEPHVEVGIRYSQSVTDRLSVVLDDPDQGSFKTVIKQAEDETDKRGKSNVEKLKGKGKKVEPAEPSSDDEPARVTSGTGE